MNGSLRVALFKQLSILHWIVACLIVCSPQSIAQRAVDGENPKGKWEVLEKCRLVTNSVNDGDSFMVTHKGREYIFRLYFVDAPETDTSWTDRIHEQAGYFGISVTNVTRAGRLAAEFTRKKLAGRDVTVVTRWENAKGMGALARFYGVVLVRGDNLAEELIRNGLARIHGKSANWPDGPHSAAFIEQLNKLELTAQEKRRGVWDSKMFPRLIGAETGLVAGHGKKINTGTLNLNDATFDDLQTLPGIGPVLAQRIIAGRPYRSVDDLLRVSGIGKTRLKALRPFARVE